MALTPGTRLGPYEIHNAIGAGGMGEVYKATDTRLDRTVAIKVLSEHVAADSELKQRFEREAKTLAALSHPHICFVFDVGQQDGVDFLVMEYLEGETLAERLARKAGSKDPALLMEDVLRYSVEIADALDKAHRKGIVHRDLKPGNIFLCSRSPTPARARHTALAGGASRGRYADQEAHVKLLDFGLAKRQPSGAVAGMSIAATLSSPLTGQGTILGTLHYMAPEQVEGTEADDRSDIFSFGALMYEMATAKKAFEGKSPASVIAAILEREPPAMSSLQPLTPPLLDRVVHRCLAKDPDERWQSARDLLHELKWIAEAGPAPTGVTIGTPAAISSSPVWRRVALLTAALVVGAAIATTVTWVATRPVPPAPEMRLEITTPPARDRVSQVSLAMSPDGQKVVFVGESEGRSHLWVRSLDAVSPRPLDKTDGASYPFWSPDSRSVGFFADGRLKRIDLDGGTVQTLSDAPFGLGGTWNRDGVILFAPGRAGLIFRLPASGGEPVAVTRVGEQDQVPGRPQAHQFPQFLPDGRHFLYFARGAAPGVHVGQVDGSETRRVVEADAGSAAVYASSGHLLFVRQGTLFAQRFDPVFLSLTGNPFPVAEGVGVVSAGASGSAASAIVYRTTTVGAPQRQFVWFDRSGKEIAKVGDPYAVSGGNPSMSPDGRYVALARVEGGNPSDLWLLDTARGVFTRFTSDPFVSNSPVWSPDGSRIVFQSNLKGVFDLYQKATTGAGSLDLLLATAQDKLPNDWSPDGRFLLYQSSDRTMPWDLWALPLDDDGKPGTPLPVVQTNSEERNGQFSPDGKWIAYDSDETGRFETYLQPFPGSGGKVRISTTGGTQVHWRRDGHELFYVALDDRLMAVPIRITPDGRSVEPGVPVPLFTQRTGGAGQFGRAQYVVSPDGKRFGVNTVLEEATATPITVILNWTGDPER